MKTCAFTGHRPRRLPFGFNENDIRCKLLKDNIRSNIMSLIENKEVVNFISGMALGIDMYAAEIVLELKEYYPFITLEAAIPCENQSAKWISSSVKRYNDILKKTDKITILQKEYTPTCMQKRNKYMVDNCDYLIAVYNGKPGGTRNTLNYAERVGKEVILINPTTMY